MSLTKEQILGASDLRIVEIDVPEWGDSVFIKTMSGKERDSLEGEISAMKGRYTNVRARYAVRVICDPEGNLLFEDKDANELGDKSGAALDRIFEKIMDENKISEKDIEDTVKN